MSNTASAAKPVNDSAIKDGPLDVFKFRWLFIGISLAFLIPGIYFIIANLINPDIQAPVRLGIDFKGGTLLEYGFSKSVNQSDIADIRTVFDKHGYEGSVIQIQQPRVGINQKPTEIGAPESAEKTAAEPTQSEPVKAVTPPATTNAPAKPEALPATKAPQTTQTPATATTGATEASKPSAPAQPNVAEQVLSGEKAPAEAGIASIVSIRSKHIQGHDDVQILDDLKAKYGPITLLQKNSIGPALAKELLVNGLLALLMAYILIVGYLTFRFQFDFAMCAMAALIHDTVFLIGMFAMFGALFHTEVDSLFITAILTVVGFSVHDTIVVFDRIRENNRLYFTKKVPFIKIVNMSINQTLARSINTSLTVLLTMLAMYFFGGDTTKDFVLAIIIGIAAGTYSSIFNASVLLAMWRNRGQSGQVQAAAA